MNLRYKETPAPFKYISSLLVTFLYINDPIFIIMDGRALNHAIPALLSLAAFVLFCVGNRTGRLSQMLFFSGLMVGLAIGVRLSNAVQIVAYGFVLLVYPFDQEIRLRLRNVLIFVGGISLGLLPVIILFLIAPYQFIYGNYS